MTKEYEAIKKIYGDQRARRSQLPYIRHIDCGLRMLRTLGSADVTERAWCVHPIYQLDSYFYGLSSPNPLPPPTDDPRVVLLAMEYRRIANDFLTHDVATDKYPGCPTIDAVRTMLVVDKVHNWYDARKYLYPQIPTREQRTLDVYFTLWLLALNVSSNTQRELEAVIDGPIWTCPHCRLSCTKHSSHAQCCACSRDVP